MRATYIGCIGTHAHGSQVKSLLCLSDVIVTFKGHHHVQLHLSLLRKLILNKKNCGEQEK